MRVIKEGKKEKEITCTYCGSELAYTFDDVKNKRQEVIPFRYIKLSPRVNNLSCKRNSKKKGTLWETNLLKKPRTLSEERLTPRGIWDTPISDRSISSADSQRKEKASPQSCSPRRARGPKRYVSASLNFREWAEKVRSLPTI